jgi:CHAT domain-containing protein
LYDILVAPIEQDLQQAKAQTLMLSLEGALRYIPFSALHDGTSYVAEQYRTVMYAEAARQTITMPVRADWTIAALGVSAKVHPDFSPLPSVPAELAGIVRKDGKGALSGESYLDKEFTEAHLQDASGRNPVLHIASHFKFSTGIERDSFLLLGDGTPYTLDKVRSGTAFSSAELLTLSACETALGTTGTGREIEGFGALAMNSGTKAVIATLWSIADDSTALLMQQFYGQREEQKLTKVEALRQAQLSLLTGRVKGDSTGRSRAAIRLKETPLITANAKPFPTDPDKPYAHPYYWAPFILMGNWK